MEKYINLFTDFGFKKIFGTDMNKDLLIDFLNELLKDREKIKSLTYLKTEHLGSSQEDRKAVFDLYCENEQGEKFIVELQKVPQEFFKDKWLYVIKNLHKLDKIPDKIRDRIFQKLFEQAEIAKYDEKERTRLPRKQKTLPRPQKCVGYVI
jgi:hypothetical protein